MIILKTIDYNLILIESKYSANSIRMIIHNYNNTHLDYWQREKLYRIIKPLCF